MISLNRLIDSMDTMESMGGDLDTWIPGGWIPDTWWGIHTWWRAHTRGGEPTNMVAWAALVKDQVGRQGARRLGRPRTMNGGLANFGGGPSWGARGAHGCQGRPRGRIPLAPQPGPPPKLAKPPCLWAPNHMCGLPTMYALSNM